MHWKHGRCKCHIIMIDIIRLLILMYQCVSSIQGGASFNDFSLNLFWWSQIKSGGCEIIMIILLYKFHKFIVIIWILFF